ncbi:MAG: diphthine synthase [Nanoarchaeota archaeon]|nr:diphthine synthase [Nanoarchaeota archaeon]
MALYLIGLGIWDEKDISLKGLECAKKCEFIFMEEYTSKLGVDKKEIEAIIGKEITLLSRKDVEQTNSLLKFAKEKDVAFLVGGDPLTATTHIHLILEAKKQGIRTKVIHSSSIYTAVCEAGLFIYKFGKSCSIPFPKKDYNPTSFYDVIVENKKRGLHTLVFLDINKEENKFMKINDALKRLLEIAKERKDNTITQETLVVGFARMGSDNQIIKFGKIKDLLEFDFGSPQHTLVVLGDLHFIEKEALEMYQ